MLEFQQMGLEQNMQNSAAGKLKTYKIGTIFYCSKSYLCFYKKCNHSWADPTRESLRTTFRSQFSFHHLNPRLAAQVFGLGSSCFSLQAISSLSCMGFCVPCRAMRVLSLNTLMNGVLGSMLGHLITMMHGVVVSLQGNISTLMHEVLGSLQSHLSTLMHGVLDFMQAHLNAIMHGILGFYVINVHFSNFPKVFRCNFL